MCEEKEGLRFCGYRSKILHPVTVGISFFRRLRGVARIAQRLQVFCIPELTTQSNRVNVVYHLCKRNQSNSITRSAQRRAL